MKGRTLSAITRATFALAAVTAAAVAAPVSTASADPAGSGVSVTHPITPAFKHDAPDPDVLYNKGAYYAFTTGTALGNYLQALVNTTANPASGWRSYTGLTYGSSALPQPPSWEQINTQTSPGVMKLGRRWLMYYDAAKRGYASDTGHDCISVASAASLPVQHPVFTDTSTKPMLCDTALGGAIDPSPFINPTNGQPYLIWKSNDGGSSQPARIWSAPLKPNGHGLAGAPTELLFNNTSSFPWELTVEDPDMIDNAGHYLLLFSAGLWDSSNYSEAYAVCSGPSGPCTQPAGGPFLRSYGSVSGPGGASAFQGSRGHWSLAFAAWSKGCTSYSCGGARKLYVAGLSLP